MSLESLILPRLPTDKRARPPISEVEHCVLPLPRLTEGRLSDAAAAVLRAGFFPLTRHCCTNGHSLQGLLNQWDEDEDSLPYP